MSAFECKSECEMKEYLGSNIDIERQGNGLSMVKFTQPVLVQKLEDEYTRFQAAERQIYLQSWAKY